MNESKEEPVDIVLRRFFTLNLYDIIEGRLSIALNGFVIVTVFLEESKVHCVLSLSVYKFSVWTASSKHSSFSNDIPSGTVISIVSSALAFLYVDMSNK